MPTVAELFGNLERDPWRSARGFSLEFDATQQKLLAQSNKNYRAALLAEWLQHHQPCLFGRIAAKYGQLGFCILDEADLQQPDDKIREIIQSARTEWTADAFDGLKSGFILFVVSSRIAHSIPSPIVADLARQLCFLYLNKPIELDVIYHEDVFLEKPGPSRQTWIWKAGVNYFCANADGRWWQDHRIPAGMAFSVNSVGHMAKAGKIAHYMKELDASLGSSNDIWPSDKVDDLHAALRLAMQTISIASEACSSKATWLKPTTAVEREKLPRCPIKIPPSIAEMNHCSYAGYYHTDITLPSEYFRADVERPKELRPQDLDFTYLFDDSLENPDYITMGTGHQIREGGVSRGLPSTAVNKRGRVVPNVADIADHPRLVAALAGRGRLN